MLLLLPISEKAGSAFSIRASTGPSGEKDLSTEPRDLESTEDARDDTIDNTGEPVPHPLCAQAFGGSLCKEGGLGGINPKHDRDQPSVVIFVRLPLRLGGRRRLGGQCYG